MKKHIFLFVLAALIGYNTTTMSQSINGEKEKNALEVIWRAYQSSKAESRGYMKPDKYIQEKGSNKIIGQFFMSFSGKNKYGKILLVFDGDKISSALIDEGQGFSNKVELGWENDKIIRVNTPNYSYSDYKVLYDDSGNILGYDRGLIGSRKIKVFSNMEFEGGKLLKVTGYANKNASSKKNTISFVTSYKYTGEDVTITTVKYEKGKPIKDTRPRMSTYKVLDNNNVYSENTIFGRTEKVWTEYNDSIVVGKKTERGDEIQVEKHTYINNKLFKIEELTTKTDGSFVKKSVDILFSLEDKPESVPMWEKKKGSYKFDNKGDLIFESNGTKYREKVNGVWGSWKFFQY